MGRAIVRTIRFTLAENAEFLRLHQEHQTATGAVSLEQFVREKLGVSTAKERTGAIPRGRRARTIEDFPAAGVKQATEPTLVFVRPSNRSGVRK